MKLETIQISVSSEYNCGFLMFTKKNTALNLIPSNQIVNIYGFTRSTVTKAGSMPVLYSNDFGGPT